MIEKETHANLRRLIFANPTFDLDAERITLRLRRVTQYRDDAGEWAELAEARALPCEDITIDNTRRIDPATGLLLPPGADQAGAMGAYDYFMSRTAAELGIQSMDGPVYPAMAAYIESLLVQNGLV